VESKEIENITFRMSYFFIGQVLKPSKV
jgi:hypothetical protein